MAAADGGLGQDLPVGTITFLLTDIEGSTRRWIDHSSVMGGVVERHDGILVQSFEKHQGHDLKKKGEGDSRFAVFVSPRSALIAAIEIQKELAKQEWGAVGPLKVRIALHSGEAEFRAGDYYGPVVNRCARMRGAAHGGQIILSEATKELIGDRLPEDISLRDLGFHRFKDLQEPDRIYQIVGADFEDVRTPLASLSATKHNLPIQLSSFVGRGDQIAAINKVIKKNRLVTLFGVGGGGKTRLALQVAADLAEDFPDGVWFADLASIQDPEMTAQAIAQNLPIAQAGKAAMDAMVDHFAEAKALFVIDNCEHLAGKPAIVINDLLRRCPLIKVLATSREQLSVMGESVFDVPPMDFDLNGKPPMKDIVAQLEAVELLRDRAAKRLSGEDILSDETAEDIYEMCKLVDGIPLALEQVAASLAYMTVHEARLQLTDHLDMLQLKEVGRPDRHQTMTATIDWSYQQLNEREKRLFLLLSIFDAGCTREAAEFVCSEPITPGIKAARLLEGIADHSLLVFSKIESAKSSRYRMLEPIRQFAASHLPGEDLEHLKDRHFEWFYNFSLQAKGAGLDADDGRYYKLLNADYDNMRKALAWGPTRPELATKSVDLCNALYPFWLRRGLIREGTTCIQRAMDASTALPEAIRAEALLWLGILQWQGGNLEAADRALRASYKVYDDLFDEAGKAKAQGNLGSLAFYEGRYEEAKAIYESVIPTFEKFGNLLPLASAHENLGVCESKLGLLDDAVLHLQKAIALYRQVKATKFLAKALDSLLGVYVMRKELAGHIPDFIEGTNIALRQPEDDFYLFENLLDCGCQICITMGEFELAAQAFGAMELSVEHSQRIVSPAQLEEREQRKKLLTEQLGAKQLAKALRDGRALGPRTMLGLLCRKIEGEG
jgi:predicted ATPase/class 3 adenylate cyclase